MILKIKFIIYLTILPAIITIFKNIPSINPPNIPAAPETASARPKIQIIIIFR